MPANGRWNLIQRLKGYIRGGSKQSIYYCQISMALLGENIYSKVKCTLVQALRLCTGRTAHRGIRGIALLFHDHGTRRRWGVSVTPRPLFTPGIDPVPIVQKAGWAPGPVLTGAENLAPTGIRSPDLEIFRGQSLYRLRCSAHENIYAIKKIAEALSNASKLVVLEVNG